MPSLQMENLKNIMRQMMAAGLTPQFDGNIDPAKLRGIVQASQARMPAIPGVRFERGEMAGVETEWSIPENARQDAIIMYIHGGGLVCGTAETSRGYASMLAVETNLPVLSLTYRLVPEHPYPAASEDCFAVYQEVLKQHPGKPVFLIGESGGAVLSIVTTLKARDTHVTIPAGVVLYSPPLEFYGAIDRNHPNNEDFTVTPEGLLSLGRMYYTSESQYIDPYATPYYADYTGFPPVYLSWDEHESLAVDAGILKEKLLTAGVEVEAKSFPHCFHAFATAGKGTPESAEVLADTVVFFSKHI